MEPSVCRSRSRPSRRRSDRLRRIGRLNGRFVRPLRHRKLRRRLRNRVRTERRRRILAAHGGQEKAAAADTAAASSPDSRTTGPLGNFCRRRRRPFHDHLRGTAARPHPGGGSTSRARCSPRKRTSRLCCCSLDVADPHGSFCTSNQGSHRASTPAGAPLRSADRNGRVQRASATGVSAVARSVLRSLLR